MSPSHNQIETAERQFDVLAASARKLPDATRRAEKALLEWVDALGGLLTKEGKRS